MTTATEPTEFSVGSVESSIERAVAVRGAGADAAASSSRSGRTEASVWVFYLQALASLVFEGSIVKVLGPVEFVALHLVLGLVFGVYHLRATHQEARPLGPILGGCMAVVRRAPRTGFVVTVVVAGAPGVAILWTKLGSERARALTVAGAVLFVAVWAPCWYGLFALLRIQDVASHSLISL